MNELLELRARGYSRPRLAAHFGVTELTITRKLRRDPVNQFANRLALMVDEAPEGFCRSQLQRLINEMRTFKTSNVEEKKAKVLNSIRSEACEVEEIAEDCSLSETETLDLLRDLEDEGKIVKRIQQKKIRYFPAAN